jgi:hypothetical protein
MKKLKLNILLLAATLLSLPACDDINSLHQKYIDQGETFYTGKVDSLEVFPGNEKVKFAWQLNSDPRITQTIIVWNDGADRDVADVNRTQSGILKMEKIVSVSEGIYDFELYTVDREGNRSLGQLRTVQIYGPKYISYLNNRRLTFSFDTTTSKVTIDWKAIETPLIQYTTVVFKGASIRVENDDEQTILTNVKAGDSFSVVTTFLPENALETLDTLPDVYPVN